MGWKSFTLLTLLGSMLCATALTDASPASAQARKRSGPSTAPDRFVMPNMPLTGGVLIPVMPESSGVVLHAEGDAAPMLSLVEAVATSLRLAPALRSARAELAQRRAQEGVARGPFDPLLLASFSHDHQASPNVPSARVVQNQGASLVDTSLLRLGASANTRWGTTITPSVELARIHQRLDLPGFVSPPPFQQATVALSVVQHLLRGAGEIGAASGVASARHAVKAAELALDFAAQQQVFQTAAAYFELVAAQQQLALLLRAEQVVRHLAEELRVLVESDQRPRTDLHQMTAT
jgi:outer membrane protein TolC